MTCLSDRSSLFLCRSNERFSSSALLIRLFFLLFLYSLHFLGRTTKSICCRTLPGRIMVFSSIEIFIKQKRRSRLQICADTIWDQLAIQVLTLLPFPFPLPSFLSKSLEFFNIDRHWSRGDECRLLSHPLASSPISHRFVEYIQTYLLFSTQSISRPFSKYILERSARKFY